MNNNLKNLINFLPNTIKINKATVLSDILTLCKKYNCNNYY